MWILDHPGLPEVASTRRVRPSVAIIETGFAGVAIAEMAVGANYDSPEVISPDDPMTVAYVVTGRVGSTLTIAITSPSQVSRIDLITIAGKTFTLATDLDAPRPGEFTWMPGEEELTLYAGQRSSDLGDDTSNDFSLDGVEVGDLVSADIRVPAVRTNVVPTSLLGILEGLPVTGDISWNLGLEQHPSGSINLVCNSLTAPYVRTRLRKGEEFLLFGIGFSVESFSETYQPEGWREISVSLTGRWARPKYNRPSLLRPRGQYGTDSDSRAIDPECQDNQNIPSGSQNRTITVEALARQVDVPFRASGGYSTGAGVITGVPLGASGSTRPRLNPWEVEVPLDSPETATAQWESEAQNWLRVCRTYLDYNDYTGVRAKHVDLGRFWSYNAYQLSVSYKGDCDNAPSYRGYAVEYINVELQGRFSEPAEETDDAVNPDRNARPNFVRRTPKRIKLTSGDPDPQDPPAGLTVIKTMGLNWDQSGPTKTHRVTESEDGMPLYEEETIYGLAYLGSQVYGGGQILGNPHGHWQKVSYKRKTYLYDPKYGYPLGYNCEGWRLGRFATESDQNPETVFLDPGLESQGAKYQSYVFRKIPITERSRQILYQFRSVYNDAQEAPGFASYKHCNGDGTSTMKLVEDPTWAPSMFVGEEYSYTNSFAKMHNPDNPAVRTQDSVVLPDLIAGEESEVHVMRQILPSNNTRRIQGSSLASPSYRNERLDYDRFVEWRKEDAAQNAQFRDKAVRETFSDNEGRPSPASRKPPIYELEQPEPEEGEPDQRTPQDSKQYFISTPGWSERDASNGSLNYPAETVAQARAGAETDLHIRDLESVTYEFEIPFNGSMRPMDRVSVYCQNDHAYTKVTQVSNTLHIEGFVDGQLVVTADPTQVSAGINRTIPLSLRTKIIPAVEDPSQDDLPIYKDILVTRIGLAALGMENYESRRNF